MSVVAKRGVPLSEDHRMKIGEAGRGKKRTEETKRKMSEVKIGKSLSELHKQSLKDAWVRRRLRTGVSNESNTSSI